MISRRARILTRDATVGSRDTVGGDEVAATTGGQWHWFRVAIGFTVRVRGPSGEALVDGELGPIVGNDVVVQITSRTQCGGDVISRRAGILTSDATVGGRDTVGGDEVAATAGGQWHWFRVAIGLTVRVRGPSGEALVDGELGPSVGDDVVVQITSRTQCGGDVIGRRTGILTRGPTVVGGDIISRHEV